MSPGCCYEDRNTTHARRSLRGALVAANGDELPAHAHELDDGLRRQRKAPKREGLIYGQSRFPISLTQITAVALLLIGLLASESISLRAGPYQ
jgi:hypothetical protein